MYNNLNPELEQNNTRVINSKFGDLIINEEQKIYFPYGLIGIPQAFNFCLAEVPDKKFTQFRLLQSIDTDDLVFLTLPIDTSNNIIEKHDIQEACDYIDIKIDNTTMLLIVSSQKNTDKATLTVNTRAPIFIDVEKRTAIQYVLKNKKYLVQLTL